MGAFGCHRAMVMPTGTTRPWDRGTGPTAWTGSFLHARIGPERHGMAPSDTTGCSSTPRGHWFDPSTAHARKSPCRNTRQGLLLTVWRPRRTCDRHGARRCHEGSLTLLQAGVRMVPWTGSSSTWSRTAPEALAGVPRIDESSGAHCQPVISVGLMPPGYGNSMPDPLPSTGTTAGRACSTPPV